MRRVVLKHMGGLFWRLTASYVVVTFIAALIIQSAMVVVASQHQLSNLHVSTQETLQKITEVQVEPLLEQGKQDQTSLLYLAAIPTFKQVQMLGAKNVILVSIFGQDGQLLVSANQGQAAMSQMSTKSVGAYKLSSELLSSRREKLIVHDVIVHKRLYVGPLAGTTSREYIVIPVMGQVPQALGAVAAIFDGPLPGPNVVRFGDFLNVVSENLQPSMLYFLLTATFVGTIAGLWITRNLTRRLHRITLATSEWGRGKFETEVLEDSRDELGQLTRDLNRMAKQLQALLAVKQTLAVLEERNRLARDLHDSVKQQVFSGALLVRAARKLLQKDPRTANQYLSEAEQVAEQMQQELAQIIAALRPTVLTNRGIADVLKEFASDWSRIIGIDVKFRVDSEHRVPIEIEQALFRIAQEALTNVARHSNATVVKASLSTNRNSVCLRICDNGSGFDVESRIGEGVGLSSMRERVEALRGTLNISSSPVGTAVEACVPLTATN